MTTTATDLLTRLATLCDPENTRSVTRAPFAVTLAGRTWTGSTNGHVLMLVDATSTADGPTVTGPQRNKLDATLTGLVDDWPATGRVTRAALRAWVGGVDDPKDCPACHGEEASLPECAECYGVGRLTETCDVCTHEHEHDCPECGGAGTEGCDHGLHAPAGGAVTDGTHHLTIDRAVLAPLLALMAGETLDVALAGPEDKIMFRGDGWRAALMPVRLDAAVVPEGPVLVLEPADG